MDWIAGVLELSASWLIGSKRRAAFLLGLTGNIAWVVYVLTSQSAYGLLLVCIPAGLVNIRNYVLWSRNKEIAKTQLAE